MIAPFLLSRERLGRAEIEAHDVGFELVPAIDKGSNREILYFADTSSRQKRRRSGVT